MEDMTLTRLLCRFLIHSSLPEIIRVAILLALDEEEQQLEMCRYLADNPEATPAEIERKAKELIDGNT